MAEILKQIVSWAIPFLLGGVATAIIAYIRRLSKRHKCVEDGIEGLLRLEIVRSYNEYTEKGYCPIYAKESLARAYKAYHNLGGNDVATDLFKKTMDLPTEKESEEET